MTLTHHFMNICHVAVVTVAAWAQEYCRNLLFETTETVLHKEEAFYQFSENIVQIFQCLSSSQMDQKITEICAEVRQIIISCCFLETHWHLYSKMVQYPVYKSSICDMISNEVQRRTAISVWLHCYSMCDFVLDCPACSPHMVYVSYRKYGHHKKKNYTTVIIDGSAPEVQTPKVSINSINDKPDL